MEHAMKMASLRSSEASDTTPNGTAIAARLSFPGRGASRFMGSQGPPPPYLNDDETEQETSEKESLPPNNEEAQTYGFATRVAVDLA